MIVISRNLANRTEVTELISDYFPTDVRVHWDESSIEMTTMRWFVKCHEGLTSGDETETETLVAVN